MGRGGRPPRQGNLKRRAPEWDEERRELRWRGQVVKRFRQHAENQELILRAFQKAGWPVSIEDPLPWADDIDSQERLHDAIKNLNRHQRPRLLIRFRGLGSGRILWEPAEGA